MSEEAASKSAEKINLFRSTMLSGLCSMVPVPFLDDILLKRVRKGVVHRILQKHGSNLNPETIEPVYAGPPRGCLAKAIGLIFSAIKKLIKKLVKTIFFFLAIRSAALDMVETYLLGRTVDRYVERDFFEGKSDVGAEALRFREAFNQALSGSDRRILAQGMRQVWSRGGGMKAVAKAVAGRFKGGSEEDEIQPEDLSAEEREAVEKGGLDIEKEVNKKEVQQFLAQFDERFDKALAKRESVAVS